MFFEAASLRDLGDLTNLIAATSMNRKTQIAVQALRGENSVTLKLGYFIRIVFYLAVKGLMKRVRSGLELDCSAFTTKTLGLLATGTVKSTYAVLS